MYIYIRYLSNEWSVSAGVASLEIKMAVWGRWDNNKLCNTITTYMVQSAVMLVLLDVSMSTELNIRSSRSV